jgi:hypothetical protein
MLGRFDEDLAAPQRMICQGDRQKYVAYAPSAAVIQRAAKRRPTFSDSKKRSASA